MAGPVPSAKGTLSATPLAHALVYARNHRLTGAFDLAADDGRRGIITLWRGRIIGVRTIPPIAYFGTVAYELGLIDSATLDATLLQVSKGKKLHGEILVARGALTEAQRDDVLVEQFCRKVHHLFSFPAEATYAFYDVKPGVDEPPIVVDPLAPIWRGIRDFPPEKFVREVMTRIGGSTLRMMNEGAIDRARLPAEEASLCEVLSSRPMTVAQMTTVTPLPRKRVELLAYLLVISKCVESVGGNRVHPSTGALPVASPSTQLRLPESVPGMAAARSPAPSGTMPCVKPLPTPTELGKEGVTKRAMNLDSESYFEALGVADGAPAEAVRAAYMRLVKLWHPERVPPELEPVRNDLLQIFTHLTKAQQTLCDPISRRAYLETHAKQKDIPRKDVLALIEKAFARRDWETALRYTFELDGADDAEAMALQAWAEARGGEASEDVLKAALSKLDRAVNTDNACVSALFYRGQVNKRLGNDKNAFRDFTRVLQRDPAHSDSEREIRIFEMRARRAR